MASGLGKTVTAAFDLQNRLEEDVSRALYVCHRTDILYQAKSEFENVIGEKISYGFLTGEEKDLHEKHLLFASFQTMRDYKELYRRKEFDYIVVDESHRSYAPTYKQTLDYFSPEYLLGMTATPQRGDGQDIEEIYGPAVFELGLASAINRGLVCSVDYRLLTDNIDFDELLEASEEKVSRAELNRQIFIPRRDQEVARIITQRMEEIEYPQNIVFCLSIEHCNRMSELLPESLPLHSEVPRNERTVRLELFRQGLIRTIVAVDCLNEGVDIPDTNVVVYLRSTSSRRIFLQQLGRGLRKVEGKDKVVALDFVSNFERIQMVRELWAKTREYESGSENTEPEPNSSMTLEIANTAFEEREESIESLVAVLERVKKSNRFYDSWQEASRAAQGLDIQTSQEYADRYKQDPLLPAAPAEFYPEFPGWHRFLRKEEAEHYPTWQEASEAAQELGIETFPEYAQRHHEDPRLPSTPFHFYPDFPDWYTFLGREKPAEKYEDWGKASKVAQKLGIETTKEYLKRYSEDSRLPSNPHRFYDDFPGWTEFLDREDQSSYYNSWEEAGRAAQDLGISSRSEYFDNYEKDSQLPGSPNTFYSDFPGWRVFLDKRNPDQYYQRWERAGKAAQELGIRTQKEYHEQYKEDSKLPSSPYDFYPDFPGWKEFLGK
jgi:superfamily II DNA or RNA helicase